MEDKEPKYPAISIRLFQTLENRDNFDEVEEHGPYKCTRSDAWLGHGYYFWEDLIELGHFWGKRALNNEYIICQAKCELTPDCWDLHGNPNHRKEFVEGYEEIKKLNHYTPKQITVSLVIEFLKKRKSFKYLAIRVNGNNTVTVSDRNFMRLKFNGADLPAFYESKPAIQYCFLKKGVMGLKNFTIVYPEQYV